MNQQFKNIFTIPPWASFIEVLAQQILQEITDPLQLRNYIILLPNRRACRALLSSLKAGIKGKLLFEPIIFPFGDIDLEIISPALALPDKAIITTSQRQALLMQLLAKHQKFAAAQSDNLLHRSINAKQAAILADKLAGLIDQANWEGIPLTNIQNIVPADMAAHWEIVLEFLKIVYDFWPSILNEMNLIESSNHKRNNMIKLIEHWSAQGSPYNVIAAGSTGSIPATAQLIQVVANLKHGRVYLPGLCNDMPADEWSKVDLFHHQYNLKQLIELIGCHPHSVPTITCQALNPVGKCRDNIISGALRPSGIKVDSNIALEGLEDFNIIECQDSNQEAKVIALIMREIVQRKDTTVALITPDRSLVKRVNYELKRWNVRADDSGGMPLIETVEADLIDKLFHFSIDPLNYSKFKAIFNNGLVNNEQLFHNIHELNSQNIKMSPLEILKTYSPELLAHCANIFDSGSTVREHITMVMQVAQNLVPTIWQNEAGVALFNILNDIKANLEFYPEMSRQEFGEFLLYEISKNSLRVPVGFHPRLFVYGAIEARTHNADIVIMSGLNEGTWPASIASDPWLNRSMRLELTLPLPERRFGLSAHDFVQGFCAKQVYLTRSQKSNGAPTVPCRWFLKIKTYLGAHQIKINSQRSKQLLAWAQQMDLPTAVNPCLRPQPNPAIAVRPKQLSVTQIEKLIVDPYAIYAYKILNLKSINNNEAAQERRIRGIVTHEILENVFCNPDLQNMPAMLALAHEKIHQQLPNSARNKYWLSRFETTAQWLLKHHSARLPLIKKIHSEINGAITFNNGFTLTARADRIDHNQDGTHNIIDYKTGVIPAKSQVLSGLKPQVFLEALILSQGGFKALELNNLGMCQFWKIGGGKKPGEIYDLPEINTEKLKQVEENIHSLITKYIFSNIPFYAIPRPLFAPQYNDYEHLARVKEWSKDMAA